MKRLTFFESNVIIGFWMQLRTNRVVVLVRSLYKYPVTWSYQCNLDLLITYTYHYTAIHTGCAMLRNSSCMLNKPRLNKIVDMWYCNRKFDTKHEAFASFSFFFFFCGRFGIIYIAVLLIKINIIRLSYQIYFVYLSISNFIKNYHKFSLY